MLRTPNGRQIGTRFPLTDGTAIARRQFLR